MKEEKPPLRVREALFYLIILLTLIFNNVNLFWCLGKNAKAKRTLLKGILMASPDEINYCLKVGGQTSDESQTIITSSSIREIKNRLPTLFQEMDDPKNRVVEVVKIRTTVQKLRCINCLKNDQPCPHLGQFEITTSHSIKVKPDNYLRAQQQC